MSVDPLAKLLDGFIVGADHLQGNFQQSPLMI
jgi:hypothetical protein